MSGSDKIGRIDVRVVGVDERPGRGACGEPSIVSPRRARHLERGAADVGGTPPARRMAVPVRRRPAPRGDAPRPGGRRGARSRSPARLPGQDGPDARASGLPGEIGAGFLRLGRGTGGGNVALRVDRAVPHRGGVGPGRLRNRFPGLRSDDRPAGRGQGPSRRRADGARRPPKRPTPRPNSTTRTSCRCSRSARRIASATSRRPTARARRSGAGSTTAMRRSIPSRPPG
jgi:hypothetical protein